MRAVITRWIEQAEADLKVARDNLTVQNYHVVAFYCQQSVEKGLKAMIIQQSEQEPPRVHSLPLLAGKVGLPDRFQHQIELLNPVYAISRYPGFTRETPMEYYTRDRAEALLRAATEVLQWIRSSLQQ